MIKGVYTLFMVSMLLAFMHSCTLDNHILKPSCLIFEVDLNEKWWYPDEQTEHPVYFRSNGRIRFEGQTDSLTFVVENCNKLRVTDHSALTQNQWVIKHISLEELHLLFPNEKLVKYTRRR